MTVLAHIAILVHRYDQFDNSRYFLEEIAGVWRERGILVSILDKPDQYVAADLGILHTDLTVVPEDYLDAIARYPKTLNASVKDISKTVISRNIIERNTSYDGPVIVKTNCNSGGKREVSLLKKTSPIHGAVHSLRNKFSWSLRSKLSVTDYRIFDTTRAVPWAVWHNPDLIVEKFQPEIRDRFYCLRTWFFLGSTETHSLSLSHEPIVKSTNVVRREELGEVPLSLRELRRELGFDYGKFDYVMVNGEPVLFDANRTPTLGGFAGEQFLPSIRLLADGIEDYLTDRSTPGHWQKISRLWGQVGQPLRPTEQDLGFVQREIENWSEVNGAPRGLILGVTPELGSLPWPEGTHLIAVDHTFEMIENVWPNSLGKALCAEWPDLPLADLSRDIVLCDGGIHLMAHPEEQHRFIRALKRVVSPGGLCIFRLFASPESPENSEDVVNDLLQGRVPNLNILKLRLGMSLCLDVTEGVELRNIFNTLQKAAPDFEKLAEEINWPLDLLLAIKTYHDSPSRYYFLSVPEVCEMFSEDPGGFHLEQVHTPDYLLGERCPTVVFRREND